MWCSRITEILNKGRTAPLLTNFIKKHCPSHYLEIYLLHLLLCTLQFIRCTEINYVPTERNLYLIFLKIFSQSKTNSCQGSDREFSEAFILIYSFLEKHIKYDFEMRLKFLEFQKHEIKILLKY